MINWVAFFSLFPFSGWSVPREINCSWSKLRPSPQSSFRQTTTRELYNEGLSQAERENCFRLHQMRARMKRDLRPHGHDVPDTEPILDIFPISMRYYIRSYREFMDSSGRGHGQYGTNNGNFGVSFGQSDTMTTEQPASTSDRRLGKEHVDDNDEMDTSDLILFLRNLTSLLMIMPTPLIMKPVLPVGMIMKPVLPAGMILMV